MLKKAEIVVFFGCSMRGGHGAVSLEELAKLPDLIEGLGYKLASRHQTTQGVIAEENKIPATSVHNRDYRWLQEAHLGVFEISNPSLGVGAEIADMLHEGRAVLCLFQGDENSISAYIRGKQGSRIVGAPLECHRYGTLKEAEDIISRFVESHMQH